MWQAMQEEKDKWLEASMNSARGRANEGVGIGASYDAATG